MSHPKQLNIKESIEELKRLQGNNTTFPTDAKLYKKIIDNCVKIAERHGIPIRQNYRRVSSNLQQSTS